MDNGASGIPGVGMHKAKGPCSSGEPVPTEPQFASSETTRVHSTTCNNMKAESPRPVDSDTASTSDALTKRIARYDQYFDTRTLAETLRKTSKPVKKRPNRQHVLFVKRKINRKGQHENTTIDILSPGLCEVLLEINEGVEGLELHSSTPRATPKLFFYSYDALKQRLEREEVKDNPDQELINDIKVAIQFVREEHAETVLDFERLLSHQEITYDHLWALFKPNSLIYSYDKFTEQPQILLVREELGYYESREEGEYALVSCKIINYDGDCFGIAGQDVKIPIFSGARKIPELPAFPLEHHPNKDDVREQAIRRGKKFAAMETHSYHQISGPGIRGTKSIKSDDEVVVKFSTYGRVMIDPKAFRRFEPNCSYNPPVRRRLDRSQLKDEDYMICTPVVLGFCFGVKTWGGFAIDRLQEIQWSDGAFKSLVLGEKQKTLVHALVKQHAKRSGSFDDFVEGKGKGLIGLLSGNPGCGKTLTAEALSETTRRPLYTLSAGELGTTPSDLEQSLSRALEIAYIWDAVLLLDEAEAFLQERSGTDVQRNALVTIFLRQLEYYQGILLLTTNRLQQCDPAFESRIHFTIQYPDLDYNARRIIWEEFFNRAVQEARRLDTTDLDRLARLSLNGRQIKNVISSAQCIALDKNATLSVEHIQAVLDVTQAWNNRPIEAVPPPEVDLLG